MLGLTLVRQPVVKSRFSQENMTSDCTVITCLRSNPVIQDYKIIYSRIIEQFSIERHKIETKVIALAESQRVQSNPLAQSKLEACSRHEARENLHNQVTDWSSDLGFTSDGLESGANFLELFRLYKTQPLF